MQLDAALRAMPEHHMRGTCVRDSPRFVTELRAWTTLRIERTHMGQNPGVLFGKRFSRNQAGVYDPYCVLGQVQIERQTAKPLKMARLQALEQA
jgi:hypothetical protein